MILKYLFIFSLIVLCWVDAIQNSKVNRVIDLTTQHAKLKLEITIYNEESNPVDSYLLAIPENFEKHMAYIKAKDVDAKSKTLNHEKVQSGENGGVAYSLYSIQLDSKLDKGKERKISVFLIFTCSLIPYPKEISQSEKQFVKYSDNAYFLSPYVTNEVYTTIKLSSANVLSHTSIAPSNVQGDHIFYGPYKSVAPFSYHKFTAHYENNRPFLMIKTFYRIIEISHWGGNIAVEDFYLIANQGAHLKGTFSRLDFIQNPQVYGQNALKLFRQILPSGAADIYYRDELGNISTSNIINDDKRVRFEISPRFPLFGGWEIDFKIGYNLPSEKYLFYDPKTENYILNISTIPNTDTSFVIDKSLIHIIFPEGSEKIGIYNQPYSVEVSKENKFTYLDVIGRPILVLQKDNMVNEHSQVFQFKYKFNNIYMLIEPSLLIVGFFVVFITMVVIRRIDFKT